MAAHKYVITFCFGLELISNNTRLLIYSLYVGTFAIITSVGGAIGIGISEAQSNSASYQITTAVLQALAAGTLLYVVFFEILTRERSKAEINGLLQLLCVVLGFSVMMCVTLFSKFLPVSVIEG